MKEKLYVQDGMWITRGEKIANLISYNGNRFLCNSPMEPGVYGSLVEIYLDNNECQPKDVFEINREKLDLDIPYSNSVFVYVTGDIPAKEVDENIFLYNVRYITSNPLKSIPIDLLNNGVVYGANMCN